MVLGDRDLIEINKRNEEYRDQGQRFGSFDTTTDLWRVKAEALIKQATRLFPTG
jgi:hypothetical protein